MVLCAPDAFSPAFLSLFLLFILGNVGSPAEANSEPAESELQSHTRPYIYSFPPFIALRVPGPGPILPQLLIALLFCVRRLADGGRQAIIGGWSVAEATDRDTGGCQ